jgi:CheY-like chemotaxis protein
MKRCFCESIFASCKRSEVLNEMLKQSPAGATVTTGQLREITSLTPVGRGVGKTAPQKTSGKRKQGSRSFRRRVLVVDDVPDVTEMIGLFLNHAGYEVTIAGSARAALRLAQEKVFDVIVSDIGMPEMNGYELAESLRRRAEYQGIPMIAVTGYSEYDDSGRALRAGFNAHLIKPIDPSELLLLINELLR